MTFHVEPMTDFDVIVIGGGHAGAEAARVCARGGARTAMVTMERQAIGRMSCNPAIGGLAKGNLVKEIDALGGLMGEATDRAGIQYKILNRSKGPAVQGPRAQCDRDLYARAVQDILASEPNLTLVEASISALIHVGPSVTGVVLHDGSRLRAHSIVVTTGTFLRALMHSGEVKTVGGRFGERSAETHRVDRRQMREHRRPAVACVAARPQPTGRAAHQQRAAVVGHRKAVAVDEVVAIGPRQA